MHKHIDVRIIWTATLLRANICLTFPNSDSSCCLKPSESYRWAAKEKYWEHTAALLKTFKGPLCRNRRFLGVILNLSLFDKLGNPACQILVLWVGGGQNSRPTAPVFDELGILRLGPFKQHYDVQDESHPTEVDEAASLKARITPLTVWGKVSQVSKAAEESPTMLLTFLFDIHS